MRSTSDETSATPPDATPATTAGVRRHEAAPRARGAARPAPRADARRNRQAVLDAALAVFASDPAATVAQVAHAAGVGRVTLYGHFPTREDLVRAALDEAVDRARRALARSGVVDASGAVAAAGDPVGALGALLGAGWSALAEGHGAVEAACRVLPAAEVDARHEPVVAPLRTVLAEGRAAAAVRDDVALDWLVAAVSALVHAAAQQRAAGLLDHDEATRTLTLSVLALVRA
ncbi:TetR/AcrR family transcriptional regulator [Cellulomonas sp. PS-H5]|uniref:TetR/AcrR family transcriptional regulator n=1 Tax=Cellulomonas sp. PS-H5 TaxID=2820400 RepID=UPI001C4FD4E2|nr:TetR/AcrR family transcriptional regulator [Cellulomonas sp. PS-H5]MBW0256220.1 TetR/AcrR family transcriptional regulator [Cellulomonas sp. PS-H5]